ncbi:MAG: extracellular solute-binding protein, partial [bacterium]|nr:extracellular solute-binding protein [bacterium]
MRYHRFFVITLLIALLSTTGLKCTIFGGGQAQKEATRPIVLNYWRVFDGDDTMKESIDAYKAIHPNVTINYQKFTFEEYEQKLLEGFSEDRGPDIFSIHTTWVDKYAGKIAPMPPVLTIGFPKVEGTLKKTVTYQVNKVRSLGPKEMKDLFVSAVYDDVVRGDPGKEQVYALPLSVDTLALFYNQDMLNSAGIIEPPKTWAEFTQMVDTERKPPLTIVNPDSPNDFIQSGAAIGTAKNIQRAGDILAAVMMQNGTKMTEGGEVTFDKRSSTGQGDPGLTALQFYTDFGFP